MKENGVVAKNHAIFLYFRLENSNLWVDPSSFSTSRPTRSRQCSVFVTVLECVSAMCRDVALWCGPWVDDV